MRRLPFVTLLLIPILSLSATEQYFPKTAVGSMELKDIPAATLIASTSDRGYFRENNFEVHIPVVKASGAGE